MFYPKTQLKSKIAAMMAAVALLFGLAWTVPSVLASAGWTAGKFGGAYDFNGQFYINAGNVYNGVKTVSFWIKGTSYNGKVVDLNGSAYVSITSAGVISATGFTLPTIYIDGTVGTTVDTNWHFVTVTTGTAINADAVKFGSVDSSNLSGLLDDVKMFNYALSAREINEKYRQDSPSMAQGGEISDSSSHTALTVTQSGTGAIVSLANTSSATADAFALTNLGSGKSFIVNDEAADATPFVIDAAGNVGIGTSNPFSGQLHVNKGVAAGLGGELWITNNAVNTTGNSARLSFGLDGTTDSSSNAFIQAIVTNSTGYLTDLTFGTFGTGNLAERMRITSNGNVGIGTTTPSQKLDIAGNININTNGTSILFSTYKGANSDGYNVWIGGGGQSSVGEVGATHKGGYNTANGYLSLYSNTTGYSNAANGYLSLYSNTTGYDNTASGAQSLYSNTTGYNNTANGLDSLFSNTTGYYNTAIGRDSGRYISGGTTANQTSYNSTYLGYDTRALADGDSNETVIGYSAIGNGSNSVTLGNDDVVKTILKGNIGIGTTTPTSKLDVSFANGSAQFGSWDGGNNSLFVRSKSVSVNQAIGFYAGGGTGVYSNGGISFGVGSNFADGTYPGGTIAMSILSSGNVGIGTATPSQKLDIAGNININTNGTSILFSTYKGANSDGNNIWIGGGGQSSVGEVGNTFKGSYNTANGLNSLYSNTTGYYNTANGVNSLYSNTTGSYNTANGLNSLYSNTIGHSNTAIGHDSGHLLADGSTANQTSNSSLYLGAYTKAKSDGDSNEIVIGYNAIGLGSNTAVLGNDSIGTTVLKGNVGIGTTSPQSALHVDGIITTSGSVRINSYVSSWGDNATNTWLNKDWNSTYGDYLYLGSTGDSNNTVHSAILIGSTITALGMGYTNGESLSSTFMTIANGTGNVGIGTTSPTSKLDVFQNSASTALTITQDGNGDFVNILDNGVSIFKIGQATVDIMRPLDLQVEGDVGVEYNLRLLNNATSYITSAGPLTISAGDNNSYENLTLTTSGTGDVIIDIASSTLGFKVVGLTGKVFSVDSSGNVVIGGVDAGSGDLSVKGDISTLGGNLNLNSLSTPAGVAVTPAGTTGSTTYGYRVSAINGNGETLASTTVSTSSGNSTLSSSDYNHISWSAVVGATGYKIYGRTAGSEQLIGTVNSPTLYYNDASMTAPSGALPTENTTGGNITYSSSTGPVRSLILVPSGATIPATGGASQVKVDGTNQSYYVLDYDEATNESAYWSWTMPDSYDGGTIDVTYYWEAAATSGDAIWCFQSVGITSNNSEDIDSALGSAVCEADTAQVGANDLASVTETKAVSGFAAGDYVAFKVYRDAAAGGDSMSGDARLVKVKIEYHVNNESD